MLCTEYLLSLDTTLIQDGVGAKKKAMPDINRLGLTPNSEPAREDRTFPSTGTLNSPSSWNECTKYGISLERKVS